MQCVTWAVQLHCNVVFIDLIIEAILDLKAFLSLKAVRKAGKVQCDADKIAVLGKS